MSYSFEHKTFHIWDPARIVAELFFVTVRYLEAEIHFSSGLIEYMPESIEVNFEQLSAFLRGTGHWMNLGNVSMQKLLYAPAVHCIAISMCNPALPLPAEVISAYPQEWHDEAAALQRTHMRQLSP